MLKRESRNSVLSFHAPFYLLHVLNDINDWLTEENGENDEIGVNLRELCIEEKEIDSNPSDECLEEEQWSGEPKDNVNRQQRYGPRKQLTRNWNVQDIDSPLDKSNYREMVYMNKNGVLVILA